MEGGPEHAQAPATARIRAVVRTHDGRIHKLTELPALGAVADAQSRVAFGIKEKTGRGVSRVYPSVTVSVRF